MNRLGLSRIGRQSLRLSADVLACRTLSSSRSRRPTAADLRIRDAFQAVAEGWFEPAKNRIAERGSITRPHQKPVHIHSSRTMTNTKRSSEAYACRPMPTTRPQGLNGKRAGRVVRNGDILGLPSRPLFPSASSELTATPPKSSSARPGTIFLINAPIPAHPPRRHGRPPKNGAHQWHLGPGDSLRSPPWCVGSKRVIRIAGIHKIGTGAAQ